MVIITLAEYVWIRERRWFSGRMLACHAGDPVYHRNSMWTHIYLHSVGGSVVECSPATRATRVRFPADAVFGSFTLFVAYIPQEFHVDTHLLTQRRWFSGRMLACHAGDPGSIPGRRSVWLFYLICRVVYHRNSMWTHIYLHSVGGSVVECSPATRATRVRFPADAAIPQEFHVDTHLLTQRRWFSGRMLACHAGDPGSIPGRRSVWLFYLICRVVYHRNSMWTHIYLHSVGGSVVECSPATRATRVRFPADAAIPQEFHVDTHLLTQRRWFSGRMLACHAGDPGSIPGRRSVWLFYLICRVVYHRNSMWTHIYLHSVGGSVVECSPATRATRVRFPADAAIPQEFHVDTHLLTQRRWFSGRMLACHAGDPGSIPGRRSVWLFYLICRVVYHRNSMWTHIYLHSVGGSVVECSPATRATRVRFPADAKLILSFRFKELKTYYCAVGY
ncbi:hypothetical protein M514_20056 [Trichuris suis]|uniref:Uncharacterized protein n=1 Tax=Trichuris suis TaxID=68888 RepID=A0A085NE65_9BILA|nr:hypothetical protein M514_20056 [Trichuris suis]